MNALSDKGPSRYHGIKLHFEEETRLGERVGDTEQTRDDHVLKEKGTGGSKTEYKCVYIGGARTLAIISPISRLG